ncbi:MAG: DUF1330 domain-containing protein [Bacteroidota bacterium]
MNKEKAVMIVIARINPAGEAALKAYLEGAGPLFKAAGGQPVNKYKLAKQIVGENTMSLVSIMEFPSQEALEGVFASDAYKALLPHRDQAFSKLEVFVSLVQ